MKQQLLTGARSQKVVIEFTDPGWMVMHDDGQIEEWDTACHALKAVRRRAAKGNTSLTLTTIEWRNVPDGFQPPQEAK